MLRERIADVGRGHVLPSESDLSAEFGVSRVTVRRALETLRDEHLVESRQGFGWFSATEPLQQRLTQLDTIERQLEERGMRPQRQIIEFAFVAAPTHVAARLHCDHVLRVAELGQNMSRGDVERQPFYELLGIPLRGATQTIGAASASPADAALLAVPVGSPVLRCERLTTSTAGQPILLSEHIFPAHRTEFVVDLPLAEPSTTPTGLRLVE